MQVYWIFALIFALIVAVFAIQNAALVDIKFLSWEFKNISLVLVILGSTAIGAILFFILGTIKQVTLAWKLKDAETKLVKLQAEVEKLKNNKKAEDLETTAELDSPLSTAESDK